MLKEIIYIDPEMDLSAVVNVLNVSHSTVANEFGFTRETNPTNNAFIDEQTLRAQLKNGIDLYAMSTGDKLIGCIAIEKSSKETGTFYIEKVSVVPEYRNQGIGVELMNFATSKIIESGGNVISIALIDSNHKLKKWYSKQGFIETGVKEFEHLPFSVCFMNKKIILSI
jgi:diamine N-acetyltransferase